MIFKCKLPDLGHSRIKILKLVALFPKPLGCEEKDILAQHLQHVNLKT